ncbi:hypothetical protein GH733_013446, partial [Mirounga leonina]
ITSFKNPRKTAVPSGSPGVQLRKILTEKAVEVETVRILVSNTALTHDIPNKNAKCDVWQSNFLTSRIIADELTNSRADSRHQNPDAQSAIQNLLSEWNSFWGREHTCYPSTQPYTIAGLALTNHKLAKAVNAHLLDNVGTNSQKKIPSTVEFCSTPAEKKWLKGFYSFWIQLPVQKAHLIIYFLSFHLTCYK